MSNTGVQVLPLPAIVCLFISSDLVRSIKGNAPRSLKGRPVLLLKPLRSFVRTSAEMGIHLTPGLSKQHSTAAKVIDVNSMTASGAGSVQAFPLLFLTRFLAQHSSKVQSKECCLLPLFVYIQC